LKYSYYPGCTARSTAVEYGLSSEAVCEALGIELVELKDWNCCGATSGHALSHELATALPGRNVAIAQAAGLDIAIPCPACYQRSLAADKRFREDEAWRAEMEELLGFEYTGQVRPRHLLEIIGRDLDLRDIAAKVKKPLAGLKPVSYYGCVLVRPPELTGWDDPEHPVIMDRLLKAVGAEPVSWSYIVDCCGASLSLNRSDVVVTLVNRLVQAAEDAGANCIVCACGMCHINLDTRQKDHHMPIFYFTELLGLAFGLPGTGNWFKRHAIDPRPLLRTLGFEV
jgi:heterodisulfide reductase subunit B